MYLKLFMQLADYNSRIRGRNFRQLRSQFGKVVGAGQLVGQMITGVVPVGALEVKTAALGNGRTPLIF